MQLRQKPYKNNIPTINITLEDKEITQIDHFKYLGSIVTELKMGNHQRKSVIE